MQFQLLFSFLHLSRLQWNVRISINRSLERKGSKTPKKCKPFIKRLLQSSNLHL